MRTPRPFLLRFAATALVVMVALWALPARATDIPGINGHITDPGHLLSSADKTTLEEKFNKIMQDTRVDTAGWITDAAEKDLNSLGLEAYRRWNIGASWDNGVFFMIPKVGRVHVILDPNKPAILTPAEVTKVVDADKPKMERCEAIAEATGGIIRNKTLKPRPEGKTDPERGRLFAYGALALLIAAIVMTVRSKNPRAGAPRPA
jgi:hypothetical protein